MFFKKLPGEAGNVPLVLYKKGNRVIFRKANGKSNNKFLIFRRKTIMYNYIFIIDVILCNQLYNVFINILSKT